MIARDKEFCPVSIEERCNAWHYKSLVLRALGQDLEAINALRIASKHNPKTAKPPKALAAICFEMGRFDEAFEAISVAVEIDPEWNPPWVSLETLYGGSERSIINEKGRMTPPLEAGFQGKTMKKGKKSLLRSVEKATGLSLNLDIVPASLFPKSPTVDTVMMEEPIDELEMEIEGVKRTVELGKNGAYSVMRATRRDSLQEV